LKLVGDTLFEVSNSVLSVYEGKDLENYIDNFYQPMGYSLRENLYRNYMKN